MTHSSTRSGTRTGVPDGVVTLLLSLGCFSILEVFAVRLEGGDNIELGGPFTRTGADGTAIDHDTRAIQTAHCMEEMFGGGSGIREERD